MVTLVNIRVRWGIRKRWAVSNSRGLINMKMEDDNILQQKSHVIFHQSINQYSGRVRAKEIVPPRIIIII